MSVCVCEKGVSEKCAQGVIQEEKKFSVQGVFKVELLTHIIISLSLSFKF